MSEIFVNGISTIPTSVQNSSGSLIFFPTGISQSEFTDDTDNLANASGSILVGSLNNDFEIQILDSSQTAFYISSSSPNPLVGMGTTNPLSNLDIRSTTGSSPANLILRTNEDGVIQVGEETGRIIFAIESSSFLGTDFIASGSTAAIFSRVTNAGGNGAYGSLVFEVNDNNNRTQPFEILELGYEVGGFVSGQAGARFSGSFEISSEFPSFNIKNPVNNNAVAYIGPTTTDILAYIGGGDAVDRGNFFLYNDGNTKVKLNTTTTSFINDGNNLAIGTTTAPEQLTVEGNISASGDIIGNINGGSF